MRVVSISKIAEDAGLVLPVAAQGVPAGFPSPAEDYAEEPLDLIAHLVRNRAASFLMRVRGDSMQGAGIFDGDILVVDRSADAADGSVIVAVVDGEFTVKRLRRAGGRTWLEAANGRYKPIVITDDSSLWGVVLHSIHSHVRSR